MGKSAGAGEWVGLAATVLVCAVIVWSSLDAKEQGGGGVAWKLRWKAEQKRRAREAELAFARDLRNMSFAVYEVTGQPL